MTKKEELKLRKKLKVFNIMTITHILCAVIILLLCIIQYELTYIKVFAIYANLFISYAYDKSSTKIMVKLIMNEIKKESTLSIK